MERRQELDQQCASNESNAECGFRSGIDSVRNVINGKMVRATLVGMAICFSPGLALTYQIGKVDEALATNDDVAYNETNTINLTKTNMPLPKGPTQLNDNPERQDDKEVRNEDTEHEIDSNKYNAVKGNFNKLVDLVKGLPERQGTKSVDVYTFKLDHGIRVKKMGSPDTLVFARDASDDDRFKMDLNQNEQAHVKYGYHESPGGPGRAHGFYGRNETSFLKKMEKFVDLISAENEKKDEEERKKNERKKKEDDKKVKEFGTETGLDE